MDPQKWSFSGRFRRENSTKEGYASNTGYKSFYVAKDLRQFFEELKVGVSFGFNYSRLVRVNPVIAHSNVVLRLTIISSSFFFYSPL
ncbi:hypothetical protein Y032_0021g344 [Ancylostoma ceylanicum]|uniref:Uncharacterized protein n=1 Tax=Ancylostoma ceylanicum TaxID=53326 RepID=A0A016UZ23_9BILA|nr:hypothetical protein Y032_0021g344 [Ancylostoma ceylanicum]